MATSTINGPEIKSYTVTSSDYSLNPAYAERCGNIVFLNVRVNRAATSDPTTLAQIPSGARPNSNIYIRVATVVSNVANAPAVSITTDGAIATTSSGTGDIRICIMYFTSDPY